jgi:hypothetical protein
MRFFGWFSALAVLASGLARAGDGTWSAWHSLGNDLSVSFAQVTKTTVGWQFRNDSSYRTLKDATFEYSFIDADTHHLTTAKDIIPEAIAPGGTFGGWAAYTANSRGDYVGGTGVAYYGTAMPVAFRFTEIHWK